MEYGLSSICFCVRTARRESGARRRECYGAAAPCPLVIIVD